MMKLKLKLSVIILLSFITSLSADKIIINSTLLDKLDEDAMQVCMGLYRESYGIKPLIEDMGIWKEKVNSWYNNHTYDLPFEYSDNYLHLRVINDIERDIWNLEDISKVWLLSNIIELYTDEFINAVLDGKIDSMVFLNNSTIWTFLNSNNKRILHSALESKMETLEQYNLWRFKGIELDLHDKKYDVVVDKVRNWRREGYNDEFKKYEVALNVYAIKALIAKRNLRQAYVELEKLRVVDNNAIAFDVASLLARENDKQYEYELYNTMNKKINEY